MAVLGPRALIDIALPTGVDAARVFAFQLEEGVTADTAISMAATAIGDANEQLGQRYGGIVARTSRAFARYRQGSGTSTMTPKAAEFAGADPIRGEQIGNMLPRNDFQDALGWSRDFLERADTELLRFDVQEIRDRWINRVDYDVVLRLLSSAENLIGAAGYDVPWVNGTAGSVDYIPPQWRGKSFTNSHTHFGRINGAISTTTTVTALEAMAKHLSEHGHTGRKVAIVSEADLSYYTGITNGKFAQMIPGEFRLTAGSTAAAALSVAGELQGIPGELFGYYNSDYGVIELHAHERFPTTYLWMGKSYGDNNPSNSLALREDKKGFGLQVIPILDGQMVPQLDKLNFKATHGVGVNDRTNGVAWQIASGSTTYAEPTIS